MRKAISILVALLLIFNLSSVLLAEDEGATYTTLTGVTLTLPPEFYHALYDGMEEDDPLFDDTGITLEDVIRMHDEIGLEFQSYADAVGPDDGQFFHVSIVDLDAPASLDEESVLEAQGDFLDTMWEPGTFETGELLGYGNVELSGFTAFKTVCQESGMAGIRYHQYSIFTDTGRMLQVNIMLISDVENPGDPIPFTDEDLEHLDSLAEEIAGTISYSGGTLTVDSQPFSMTGAAPAQSDTASNTAPQNFFKAFTGFEFPVVIIAIALAALLLIGVKFSGFKKWQEEPLSLEASKAISGFAAVAIIIHHLAQDLTDRAGPLACFSEFGVLFVGIFFFFSGYGLYTSLKTKENYLKGFLKNRLVTVLIPFYVCILIFVCAACICGVKFEGLEIPAVLSGWSLINGHMWYIVEIAILYLAFFVIYRLIKNRTAATAVMSVFVILMMAGSLMLCHGDDYSCPNWFMGEWWYNSTFLFVIGILFAKHSGIVRKAARKAYWVLLPVSGALTVLFGLQTRYALETWSYWSEIPGTDPAYGDKIHCLAWQLPWIVIFVCFVLLLMMKLRFGNPVLKFLGSISLELYLLHNLFLQGLQDGTVFRVKSASMYIVLTILMAVGLAAVVSGFDKYLISLIKGKKSLLPSSSRIHSIDVMRIVMAFMVITIHWPFDGKAGEVFITFGKTAVPFFLVVCGYMLFREDASEMMKRLVRQTKRIAIFYVAATVFYAGAYALFVRVTTGRMDEFLACFKADAIKDFLLYNLCPFSEHLWYLGSLLYALLIMILLNKLRILKPALFTAPLLIAAYVVLAHMGIGQFYQLRNAVFIGLGYTMMGMLIRRYEKKILGLRFATVALWLFAVICSVTAIVELNGYEQGTALPFISCEVLTYVIVLLCLRYPDFGAGTFAEKLGRECSLPIYIMHIFTIFVFIMTKNESFFGKYGAVAVFVVTAAAAGAYESIRHAVRNAKSSGVAVEEAGPSLENNVLDKVQD